MPWATGNSAGVGLGSVEFLGRICLEKIDHTGVLDVNLTGETAAWVRQTTHMSLLRML